MSSSNADFSNCFISLNTKFRARHLTNIHFKNVGYYRQKKKIVSFHLSNFIILKQDASEDLNCGAVKKVHFICLEYLNHGSNLLTWACVNIRSIM